MDVGIVATVKFCGSVDDLLRFVRRCRVVQPDERFAVDPLVQRWEIAPDCLDFQNGQRPTR